MDTGITCKIDDLGRVVIPKSIRKANNIEDGDELALYVENGNIILKRNSFLSKYSMFLKEMLKSVSPSKKCYLACCDTNTYLTDGVADGTICTVPCLNQSVSSGIKFAIQNANNLDVIDVAENIPACKDQPGWYAKKLYVVPNKGAIVVIAGGNDTVIISDDADAQIRFALDTIKNIKY